MGRLGPALFALVAAVATVPAAAHADADADARFEAETRVETPVSTSSPIRDVAESVVRVKVPLPASAGPHPEGCGWLSYLRFRHEDGPSSSTAADKILVAQPGVLEGAGAFDGVARNTITQAAGKGRYVEFWALDRRSNCLEDNTGVLAGVAARDPHLAVDYYYRGTPIDGRKFAGHLKNDQVTWLQNVGLEQTVRDQYDLLAREIPEQRVRKRKVLCGGHSLGGSVTGFFAEWDFDGDPSTTADAGYNQCAGYFALESRIQAGRVGTDGAAPEVPGSALGPWVVRAGLEGGIIPRTLSAPAVINTETMNLLAIAGLAANVDPGGRSDLATYIPSGFNTDTTYRVLFSRDLAAFAAGEPKVQDFRLTNAAALGGLLDDNSQPLAFLQASVGFFDGGPIADKDFPVPNDLIAIPGLGGLANLVGKEKKAIPDRPDGPLYGWRNFDRIGAPDDPAHPSRDGTPFTTAGKEVTDIRQLARSLSEHPLDFTEHYFPTRLVTDIQLASSPGVADGAVHEDGIKANPVITIAGSDGIALGGRQPGDVIAPGYQHLDVLTAAPVQNGGRPEPVSVHLAEFTGSTTD